MDFFLLLFRTLFNHRFCCSWIHFKRKNLRSPHTDMQFVRVCVRTSLPQIKGLMCWHLKLENRDKPTILYHYGIRKPVVNSVLWNSWFALYSLQLSVDNKQVQWTICNCFTISLKHFTTIAHNEWTDVSSHPAAIPFDCILWKQNNPFSLNTEDT